MHLRKVNTEGSRSVTKDQKDGRARTGPMKAAVRAYGPSSGSELRKGEFEEICPGYG